MRTTKLTRVLVALAVTCGLGFGAGWVLADDTGGHGAFRSYLRRLGISTAGSTGTTFALSATALGIGTDTPTSLINTENGLIQVSGTTPVVALRETVDAVEGTIAVSDNNGLRLSVGGDVSSGSNFITFFTTGSSNGYGPSERMRITHDSVGISDTTPDAVLEVVTNFMVSSTAASDGDILTAAAAGITTNTAITSSGNDLGWTIVDQTDNQACTTGCTSACVAGQDLAGANKPLVSCADTTADICLCAGAS